MSVASVFPQDFEDGFELGSMNGSAFPNPLIKNWDNGNLRVSSW